MRDKDIDTENTYIKPTLLIPLFLHNNLRFTRRHDVTFPLTTTAVSLRKYSRLKTQKSSKKTIPTVLALLYKRLKGAHPWLYQNSAKTLHDLGSCCPFRE